MQEGLGTALALADALAASETFRILDETDDDITSFVALASCQVCMHVDSNKFITFPLTVTHHRTQSSYYEQRIFRKNTGLTEVLMSINFAGLAESIPQIAIHHRR